jgi:hypothetical protein
MEYTKQNSSTPFRQEGDGPVELTDEQVDMVAGGLDVGGTVTLVSVSAQDVHNNPNAFFVIS